MFFFLIFALFASAAVFAVVKTGKKDEHSHEHEFGGEMKPECHEHHSHERDHKHKRNGIDDISPIPSNDVKHEGRGSLDSNVRQSPVAKVKSHSVKR